MRIVEIFNSIDGEVNDISQGGLTTFIRTAGCNLDCFYCDTPASRSQSSENYFHLSPPQIVERVVSIGCPSVLITGGEPLLQDEFSDLVRLLRHYGFKVSVETNGTILPPDSVFERVACWKVDYKLQESSKMQREAFMSLRKQDWIKIPVWDQESLEIAVQVVQNFMYNKVKARIALSPINIEPKRVLYALQQNGLWHVCVNLQVHKFAKLR